MPSEMKECKHLEELNYRVKIFERGKLLDGDSLESDIIRCRCITE